ncbi:hypothetical protein Q6348_02000 [Isoptericola sp. b441]|uniref:Uncharacterized protein n=1 Tax=Actinotalea lenta TaxID=3064654 RepID=A0ABT9D5C8_9CELL|nr:MULTISPECIES: hypothetical protein [unclassified Isoptericola]MDO8105963.1 hypothetical protein [Isoptericola sp. b441]MDO8122318.1 hypothetical protein [Isoptericola sp. b490]
MIWIWIGLLVWFVLSPVVAVLVGRGVTLADEHRPPVAPPHPRLTLVSRG